MNVICYKRVSTEDQKDKGFSLQFQEEMLRRYCEINKFNIVDVYTEDYSAKTFDRPQWKRILVYLKSNKGKVDLILCHKWDRFSRNQYDAMTTIKNLHKMGVTVNTVEQPLDLSNPDNKVLLSMYLTLPEVENDKNSKRTMDGMHRAKIEGCWTGSSPRGYTHTRIDKKSTLVPNEDSTIIIKAFERMASGSYSAEEVRRWLNTQAMKLSKQTFLNLIRNPVYTGKILVKEYGNDARQLITGLHPAIITEELFHRANDVLSGRKRNMKFHDDKTDLYPLKGLLKCPVHGTALTAYGAAGCTKRKYHYYFCTKCGSEQRHRVNDVHRSVEDILSIIQVTAQTLNLYKKILEKLFDKEDYFRRDQMEKVKKDIERKEQQKSNLQDGYMDGDITHKAFNEMIEKIDREMALLKNTLNGLQQEMTPYKNYIKHTLPMMENLVEYYRKADGKTKNKILSCIFAEKLIIEKGRVATTPFSPQVQVLLNIVKGFQRSKKKQEVDFDLLSMMAPLNGQSCNFWTSSLFI